MTPQPKNTKLAQTTHSSKFQKPPPIPRKTHGHNDHISLRSLPQGRHPDPEAKHAAEALSAENVSTKADINGAEERLRRYIDKSKEELAGRITDLDEKFSGRMTALDDKLSPKIVKLERDMAVMKWMMGTTIAGILFLIGVSSPLRSSSFSKYKNPASYSVLPAAGRRRPESSGLNHPFPLPAAGRV